jgi:hypothetical protein
MDFSDCQHNARIFARTSTTNAVNTGPAIGRHPPKIVFNYSEDNGGSWERIFSVLEAAAGKLGAEKTRATDESISDPHPSIH